MHTRLTRGAAWGMHPDIQVSYVHNRNAYYIETVVFVNTLKMLWIWYIQTADVVHRDFTYNRFVLHATCNEIYQRVHVHPSPSRRASTLSPRFSGFWARQNSTHLCKFQTEVVILLYRLNRTDHMCFLERRGRRGELLMCGWIFSQNSWNPKVTSGRSSSNPPKH